MGSWVSIQPAGPQHAFTWDLKLPGAEPPSAWWAGCSLEGRTPGRQTPLEGHQTEVPPPLIPLHQALSPQPQAQGKSTLDPRARPSCLLGLSNEARPRLEALLLFIPPLSYLISTQTQLFSRVYVTPPSSPSCSPGPQLWFLLVQWPRNSLCASVWQDLKGRETSRSPSLLLPGLREPAVLGLFLLRGSLCVRGSRGSMSCSSSVVSEDRILTLRPTSHAHPGREATSHPDWH